MYTMLAPLPNNTGREAMAQTVTRQRPPRCEPWGDKLDRGTSQVEKFFKKILLTKASVS